MSKKTCFCISLYGEKEDDCVVLSPVTRGCDNDSYLRDNQQMRGIWIIVALACACNPKPAPAQTTSEPIQTDKESDTGATVTPTKIEEVTFLDQGWSAKMREKFYYTPQGSHLIPYDWYLALEHPDAPTLLRDDAYLASLRFLPNSDDAGGLNPGKLPIGLTYETDKDGKHWLGMTCAACHTGQLTYNGSTIRVDGAPTLANMSVFLKDVRASLAKTHRDDTKFRRFAKRVLGEKADDAAKGTLREQLEQQIGEMPSEHPDAGFGREDAFGVILNEVTGTQLGIPENLRDADAPVSFPHVWTTPHLAWLQYNGSVENPIARNVGEVLGVFGHIEYPDEVTQDGFASTVNLQNLYELEQWLSTLKAPKWPEQLPSIDEAKAARGKEIYIQNERCSGCHPLEPYPMTAKEDNKFGKQWIQVKMIPLEKIGTDPRMITQAMERKAKTGKLAPYFKGAKEVPALNILFLAANQIFTREAKQLGLPEEEQVAFAGFRIPGQDAPNPFGYKARPLDGIWATAPYLHNGSVPNLYQLMLPGKQRVKRFSVGSQKFDPQKVGYVSSPSPGDYTFDTSKPGNSNTGHEYAGDLSDEDRYALVEFLKTL